MTKVIYEAPRPRYVVQEEEVDYVMEYGEAVPAYARWLDIKGYDHLPNAQQHADAEKRRNPGTGYRVVDTSVDE